MIKDNKKIVKYEGGIRFKVNRWRQSTPIVTIITVVYNGANEIASTIKSTIHQKELIFEYIIVDGGSTDETIDLIQNYEDDVDYWLSEPDKGIYDAMNKGVKLATGEWIIFMNCGDRFKSPTIIGDFQKFLSTTNSKTIMIYGDAEIYENNKIHIQNQKSRHLDITKSIIHQSIFVKRSYLLKFPFDTTYKIMADYDNVLKVTIPSPNLVEYFPAIICQYDKSGISSKPLYTYFNEYYSIAWRRMSLVKFAWFTAYILPRLLWSFRSLFKYNE